MKRTLVRFADRVIFVAGLLLGTASVARAPNTPTNYGEKIDAVKVLDWLENANEYNMIPRPIDTYDDIVNLFHESLRLIYEELCLEECPVPYAYGDGWNGSKDVNTLGIGSTYAPENIDDYNNPNAVWFQVKKNNDKFVGKTYSYEDMLKLVIGWAEYRTKVQHPGSGKIISGETVLERMYTKLKGAKLTPNEFSALICAIYNMETNINTLCPFIRDNYQDPLKCANKIMGWSQSLSSRCVLEALVYFGEEGFYLNLQDMTVSGRCSCINVGGITRKTLDSTNVVAYTNANKEKYLSVKGTKIKETEAELEDYFNESKTLRANIYERERM